MTIPHIIGYLILTTPFLFWLGAIWYRYDLEAKAACKTHSQQS